MSSGTADALGLSRAILCNGESPPPTQLWLPGSQAWAFFRGRGIMATHQAIVGPTGLALAWPWPLPVGPVVTISISLEASLAPRAPTAVL